MSERFLFLFKYNIGNTCVYGQWQNKKKQLPDSPQLVPKAGQTSFSVTEYFSIFTHQNHNYL